MNRKEIITENSRMKINRNIMNQTNPNYLRNINLSKNSQVQKKKNKFNSYDNYNVLTKQKVVNKRKKKKTKRTNLNINEYKPKNRNCAIIRNSSDVFKYMPKANMNEVDNNYYLLLNDFEVKNQKGNTSFYLIYDDQNINKGFNGVNTIKYQGSSKLRFNQFLNKNKNQDYKHNISKISLPFCVYSQKSTFYENEKINKYNKPDNLEYVYRNNNILGFNLKVKEEESKNNEIPINDNNHNFKDKRNNTNNRNELLTISNRENTENNITKKLNQSNNSSENKRNNEQIPIMPSNSEENKSNEEENEKKEEEKNEEE